MNRERNRLEFLKEALGPPYIALLIIGASFYAGYWSLLVWYPNHSELRGWFVSLTVVAIGSYLTTIIIDVTLHRRERLERERIERLAMEQLRGHMNSHLQLLTEWYIAALDERPDPVPDSYEELLSGDYIQTVQHLDFSEPRPGHQTADDWFEYSSDVTGTFQEGVDEKLQTYAPFLGSEMLETFQRQATSDLGNTVSRWGNIDLLLQDAEMGVLRTYNMFRGEGFEDVLEEHIELVLEAVEYYKREDSPNLNNLGILAPWRDDVHPFFGSARIGIPIEQTDPRFIIGPRPLAYEPDGEEQNDST